MPDPISRHGKPFSAAILAELLNTKSSSFMNVPKELKDGNSKVKVGVAPNLITELSVLLMNFLTSAESLLRSFVVIPIWIFLYSCCPNVSQSSGLGGLLIPFSIPVYTLLYSLDKSGTALG